MYEAATVDDIIEVYNQFRFDDEHLFTCVGTSGKAAPPRCVFWLKLFLFAEIWCFGSSDG